MEESGLEPWSVGRELGDRGDEGVRAGTLECREGARGRGIEEGWESGLEPWIVGECARGGGMEERWESRLEPCV